VGPGKVVGLGGGAVFVISRPPLGVLGSEGADLVVAEIVVLTATGVDASFLTQVAHVEPGAGALPGVGGATKLHFYRNDYP
jgi:hypothetical protein